MPATRAKPIRVKVTEADIRDGEGGECWRCAVALALQRATGDSNANAYRRDGVLYLEVWSLSIDAPYEVAAFVSDYDDQMRRQELLPWLSERLEPFAFTLPHQKHRDWKERCYGCEELVDQKAVDDEGYCPECQATEK